MYNHIVAAKPSDIGAVILYKPKTGGVALDVTVQEDTIWLPQTDIARLFDVNVPAISKHINNIFDDGELKKSATVSKMEIVQKEGKRGTSPILRHQRSSIFRWEQAYRVTTLPALPKT